MTTMTTASGPAARAWIACLACYNSGDLVGAWYDAAQADDVAIDALHVDSGTITQASCEEMWVMDHEHLPLRGECSPAEAAEWGRLLDDVDERQRDALLAWVRSGDYVAEAHGNLPSLPDFEERYAGEWDSFTEYAEELAKDTGMLTDVPEWARPYFDMDKFAHDLAFDHTTEPAPGGGLYVFRSL
ncbi:antirestriction protein ArdA [Aeromicrobium sp. JJY06]|uniref:antirestriction protein ArdA n=1 Tax=Aeromicrobium sp. JJY06 TaxID=3373478 RepID=UPI00376F345C